MTTEQVHAPEAVIEHASPDTLVLRLSGAWCVENPIPSVDEIERKFPQVDSIQKMLFDTSGLSKWDSQFLVFMTDLKQRLVDKHIRFDTGGLPEGVVKILTIALAVPEKKTENDAAPHKPFFVTVGEDTIVFFRTVSEMLVFIGSAVFALNRLFVGKSAFRRIDFVSLLRECGADALPIVSLISMLVGLILAFVGATQLMLFGAQIYVANLVGVAMVRVLGAVMTGIILTGRTGAAFAAQLGTMQVNEELDALETLGISPMEFLVLPRLLAMTVMMPLLCLYSNLMGILGGMIVGITMLDITVVEYFEQTIHAIGISNLWIGLFHGLVFGVLVSLSGCLRGIQCGRSASAVGQATTSAVVTGIVSIVVATALITVLCNVVGI